MLCPSAMRNWRAILGRNVRRIRQQRALTQEQLAFDAEIDLTYLGVSKGAGEIRACS